MMALDTEQIGDKDAAYLVVDFVSADKVAARGGTIHDVANVVESLGALMVGAGLGVREGILEGGDGLAGFSLARLSELLLLAGLHKGASTGKQAYEGQGTG